nr:AAA family ATPase [Leucobacter exalbidus]
MSLVELDFAPEDVGDGPGTPESCPYKNTSGHEHSHCGFCRRQDKTELRPSSRRDDEVRAQFPLADLAALVDPDRPERSWFWGEVVPEGEHVSIVAPAGEGKSLLTLALAVSAASGARDFIGRPVQLPVGGRVLYLDMENSEDDHSERLIDLGVTPANVAALMERLLMLSLPPLSGLDTHEGAQQLRDILDAYGIQSGDVVVLDSTQRVTEGEENSSDTFRRLYNLTSVELKRRGLTVIRTDNTGHAGDRVRGSSGKRDDVGASFILKRDQRDPEVFSLTPTKRRSKGKGGALTFRRGVDEHGLLVFVPERSTFGDLMGDVRELLDRIGVPTDAGQNKAWQLVKVERERMKAADEEFPKGVTARLVEKVQAERGFSITLVTNDDDAENGGDD